MSIESITPLRVYGLEVSYFTGKLEAYLRYRSIPYERITERSLGIAREHVGVAQMPSVALSDGRWMSDTTPMIAWLEAQLPGPSVIPEDAVQAFFALLLEDYGDEWLWRPAMHYRWHYAADSRLLSRKIVDQLTGHVPLPRPLKRFFVRTRQRTLFTRGDGVDSVTLAHVEETYRKNLAWMSDVLGERPFLLGDRPTIADFGYFGSMFRHFGMDPTPSTIMREEAPAVYAWVARVWNARRSTAAPSAALAEGVPESWDPILDEIGATHLTHLAANAEAWRDGRRHFDVEIQGVRYRKLRTSPYRVWCLEQLRRRFDEIPQPKREAARARLEAHGCWEPLWREEALASGIDPKGEAPFGRGASMTGLGRKR